MGSLNQYSFWSFQPGEGGREGGVGEILDKSLIGEEGEREGRMYWTYLSGWWEAQGSYGRL